MTKHYPFLTDYGTLMRDEDFERLVREKCGDEAGGLLHALLYGDFTEEELNEALSALETLSSGLDDLASSVDQAVDHLKKLRGRLPRGGG